MTVQITMAFADFDTAIAFLKQVSPAMIAADAVLAIDSAPPKSQVQSAEAKVETKAEDDDAPPKAKRGRPPKAAAPTEPVKEDDEWTTDDDDGDIDLIEDEKPMTCDGDLIPAFKAFAKANSEDKAKDLLKKHLAKAKVKSIRDLTPAQIDAVVKAFKA